LRVILSDKGEEDLKEFLRQLKDRVSSEDKSLIERLINEVKIGKLLKFNPKKWYVIYRGQRSFASVVIKGDTNLKTDHHVVILETSTPEVAYYYSGVLNYLVSKVEKGFIRDQFARPLLAIIRAGLEWRAEDWQYEIAELSKELHKLAEKEYKNLNTKLVKKYIQSLENLR